MVDPPEEHGRRGYNRGCGCAVCLAAGESEQRRRTSGFSDKQVEEAFITVFELVGKGPLTTAEEREQHGELVDAA